MGEIIGKIEPPPDHQKVFAENDPNDVLVVGDEVWVCNCGGVLFFLTGTGAKCQSCGLISTQWAE